MAVRASEAAREFTQAVGSLDEAFGQRARLGIMSCLISAAEMSFLELKEVLELTDGNLSSHLAYLEKKRYVDIRKGFQGKRPFTSVSVTETGRAAFSQYISALEGLLPAIRETGT